MIRYFLIDDEMSQYRQNIQLKQKMAQIILIG